MNAVRQVAVPAELLKKVGLRPGDLVHFRLSDHDPDVIEISSSDIVGRRYPSGRNREAPGHSLEPQASDDMR